MTKTYIQIQKQIETLQREADKLKRKEVEDVISKIKEAIRVYELTAADLGLDGRGAARRTGTAAKRGRPAAKGRTRGPADAAMALGRFAGDLQAQARAHALHVASLANGVPPALAQWADRTLRDERGTPDQEQAP